MAILAVRLRNAAVIRGLVSLALAMQLAAGCTFSREVINPHVKDIDTAWIKVGVTTRADVIRRIGMPPTVKEMGGVRPNSFRWTTYDTQGGIFEAGYIFTPTFKREHEMFANDILIRFDDDGVVTFVSRTSATHDDGIKVLEWREK